MSKIGHLNCSADECIHNAEGVCDDIDGVSIDDMGACLEVHCGYEAEEDDDDSDDS